MSAIRNKFVFIFVTLALLCPPVFGQYVDQKIKVTESMLAASSTYDGYTPIKSFDYDLSQNSGWCAEGGQKTGWNTVDFGSVKDLSRVRLNPDRYIATDPSYGYLDRFRVDVWKDGSWQAMSSLIRTPDETWNEVPLSVSTNKVRIWAESDGNAPQIKGIEIYEKAPAINILQSRTEYIKDPEGMPGVLVLLSTWRHGTNGDEFVPNTNIYVTADGDPSPGYTRTRSGLAPITTGDNGYIFFKWIFEKADTSRSWVISFSPDPSDSYAPGSTKITISSYIPDELSAFAHEADILNAYPDVSICTWKTC